MLSRCCRVILLFAASRVGWQRVVNCSTAECAAFRGHWHRHAHTLRGYIGVPYGAIVHVLCHTSSPHHAHVHTGVHVDHLRVVHGHVHGHAVPSVGGRSAAVHHVHRHRVAVALSVQIRLTVRRRHNTAVVVTIPARAVLTGARGVGPTMARRWSIRSCSPCGGLVHRVRRDGRTSSEGNLLHDRGRLGRLVVSSVLTSWAYYRRRVVIATRPLVPPLLLDELPAAIMTGAGGCRGVVGRLELPCRGVQRCVEARRGLHGSSRGADGGHSHSLLDSHRPLGRLRHKGLSVLRGHEDWRMLRQLMRLTHASIIMPIRRVTALVSSLLVFFGV